MTKNYATSITRKTNLVLLPLFTGARIMRLFTTLEAPDVRAVPITHYSIERNAGKAWGSERNE